MLHAGKGEESGPDEPAEPVHDAAVHEDREHDVGRNFVELGREGVEDVAAVELAGGDEVERRNEDADPTGDEDGMPEERAVEVDMAMTDCVDEVGEKTEQEWVAEGDQPHGLLVDRFGEGESDGCGDEGDGKAGDGAEGSDGEEGGARLDAGLQADDGAGGSRERGGGQHEGQRGADAVILAGEVVSELVDEKDAEECGGEREAGGELAEVVADPVVGEDVLVRGEGEEAVGEIVDVAHADDGGGEEGDDKQEGVEPVAVRAGWLFLLRWAGGRRFLQESRCGHG